MKRYAAMSGVLFWIALIGAIGLMFIDLVVLGLAFFVFAFIFMVVALIYDAEDHEIRKQHRRERREAKRRLKVEEA